MPQSVRTSDNVHKDCPFTREQILEMKGMLYSVNTANVCCNPAPISWAVGYQQYEQMQREKCSSESYKKWLENELRNLE